MSSSSGSPLGSRQLRSLDDFVLGSARFQLPGKDLEKWGDRVVKNLLYYKTNYFLMFLGIYGIMIIFNPVKILSGIIIQALLIAIVMHFFCGKSSSKVNFIASHISTGQANDQQKWYFLAGALLFGYLFLHWIGAVLLTTFTLLLPISLIFIHASLRLDPELSFLDILNAFTWIMLDDVHELRHKKLRERGLRKISPNLT